MRKAELKITYYQRKDANPKEKATIFCRVRYGRKLDVKFTTGLKIKPNYLNIQKGRCEYPKEYYDIFPEGIDDKAVGTMKEIQVNMELDDLEAEIKRLEYDCAIDNVELNNLVLKTMLDARRGKLNKMTKLSYFSEYAEKFIEEVSNENAPRLIMVRGEERKAAKSTVSRYRLTLKRFNEYERDRNAKFKPIDIDRHFRTGFLKWLRRQGYTNNNTLYEHVKNIRRFAKMAEFDGYTISSDIHNKDMFPKMRQNNELNGEEIKEAYLTKEEQRELLNLDLSHRKSLQNARDLFIILCQTGLRIGDLKDAMIEQLYQEEITITTDKIGNTVVIPVMPFIREIMDKGKPYAIGKNTLNKFIKEMCKEVGFTEHVAGYKMIKDEDTEIKRKKIDIYPRYELMSSHTGRRSFATNALKDGVSAALICKITGHSTESMLYRYLKITPKESAEQFRAFYEKESNSKD